MFRRILVPSAKPARYGAVNSVSGCGALDAVGETLASEPCLPAENRIAHAPHGLFRHAARFCDPAIENIPDALGMRIEFAALRSNRSQSIALNYLPWLSCIRRIRFPRCGSLAPPMKSFPAAKINCGTRTPDKLPAAPDRSAAPAAGPSSCLSLFANFIWRIGKPDRIPVTLRHPAAVRARHARRLRQHHLRLAQNVFHGTPAFASSESR